MGRSQHLPRTGPPDPGAPLPDDTGCTILHVDMDAFFVAVEVRGRPELRGRPVVVGGTGTRGVVSSASYEARSYGIRSAMPTGRARRLCPHAVFIQPDHRSYSAVSRAVMAIFRDVTPLVEPLSLDEAFLDVTGARRLFGRPAEIGALIRRRVEIEQGITCSVGVAPVKFVAKLASSRCKPDGLQVVPAEGVLEYLHALPVDALWGVGDRTAAILRRLGLSSVADLAATPLDTLRRAVGDAAAEHLHQLAHGRDPRRVTPDEPERSVSAEETFDTDVDDPEMIRREILRLADKVATRLRRAGVVGRTVSIKIRFADFTTITRSRTLGSPTDVSHEIVGTARTLYDALGADRARLRLVGVRVEGLTGRDDTARQLALDDPELGWREADQAVDAATQRFGDGVVLPASLVRRASARPELPVSGQPSQAPESRDP
jgi:DNA polymerase-4